MNVKKKHLLGTVDKQVHCCQNKPKLLANRWITQVYQKVCFTSVTTAKKTDFVTERDRKQRHPSVKIIERVEQMSMKCYISLFGGKKYADLK